MHAISSLTGGGLIPASGSLNFLGAKMLNASVAIIAEATNIFFIVKTPFKQINIKNNSYYNDDK